MFVPSLGEHVSRAAANCRVQATVDCFAITGGVILMTYLLVRVTTLIGDDGAMTLLLQHDEEPTGAITVFCAAAAINTDILGTLYDCTGDPGDALRVHTPGVGAAGLAWPGGWVGGDMSVGGDIVGTGWILGAGHIQWLTAAADAGDDGQVSMELFYIPLEEGVAVVAE